MSRTKRKLFAIAAVCGAGTLFQTGLMPTSCVEGVGQFAVASFDFCSVFNCTGGTFFNLCEPVALFVDCPGAADNTTP